jgi:DNA primase
VRFLGASGDGKIDPDLLFLERGIAAYDEVRQHAQTAMAFACRAVLPDVATASSEQKARAAQAVFEIITAAESEMARSEFVAETAAHLRLSVAAAQKDFQAFAARQSRQAAARPAAPEAPAPAANGSKAHTPEQHLLLLWLHFDALHAPLSRNLHHEWVDHGHLAGALLNRFIAEFEQNNWPGRDHLDELLETAEERALVANLLFETPKVDDPMKVASDGVTKLRNRALETRIREIELQIAEGNGSGALVKERLEISRILRTPVDLKG